MDLRDGREHELIGGCFHHGILDGPRDHVADRGGDVVAARAVVILVIDYSARRCDVGVVVSDRGHVQAQTDEPHDDRRQADGRQTKNGVEVARARGHLPKARNETCQFHLQISETFVCYFEEQKRARRLPNQTNGGGENETQLSSGVRVNKNE